MTIVVYTLAMTGRDGATPVRMVLVGVAFSAVLGGIASAITLVNRALSAPVVFATVVQSRRSGGQPCDGDHGSGFDSGPPG